MRLRSSVLTAFLVFAAVFAARPGTADAGILDLFYVSGGVGFESVNLDAFKLQDDLTADLLPSRVSGVAPQIAAGVRILFITAGVRASVAFLDDDSETRTVDKMQLWNLDAEVAVRTPFGPVEPYLVGSIGYTTLGGLSDAINSVGGGFDVKGMNFQVGAGVDVTVAPSVDLGVRVSGGLMLLGRSGVSVNSAGRARLDDSERVRMVEDGGTSLGTMVNMSGVATYRF